MEEHILVCLSASPSNQKTIRAAANMAAAFKGPFTALFVETTGTVNRVDRKNLRSNIQLAEQLGAKIELVYGDDIAYQISEFARLSSVSKIVLGRSNILRNSIFAKSSITEKLIFYAPYAEIYLIPNYLGKNRHPVKKSKPKHTFILSWRDILKSLAILLLATFIGFLFLEFGFTEANIIMVYILAVLVISVITSHRIYSLVSSAVSVVVFNFFFTVPYFSLLAYDKGYPVTFLIMFTVAFITSSLAIKLKNHAKQAAQSAFRTKVLLDTNQLLQKAKGKEEIEVVTANQLTKLLGRNIVIYSADGGTLEDAHVYFSSDTQDSKDWITDTEKAVATWVLHHNKRAGATTKIFPNAKCLYLAIRVNKQVYGIVGIETGNSALDSFENSVLLSILGECALALENEKNAREKEKAAILAKNEQLRANLLRAISHDLRTPLTSISGNADNLLSNSKNFDETTKMHIYEDIYDDARWLINLVENLLAVTKIEDGRMKLRFSSELMDDVIAEALHHVNRKSVEHTISVRSSEEFILAKMDARLIVQVVINIIDNAIKYTPKNSTIVIDTEKIGNMVLVKISDDGPGIPDEMKNHVFDMFYSGANKIADSRRSLGLGLSLCKSIINAHGGEISVVDNKPHGCVFQFTLPAEEVNINE